MFNNSNPQVNGQEALVRLLVEHVKDATIFDVGAGHQSVYTSSPFNVYYFDVNRDHIAALTRAQINNKKSVFETVGLSDVPTEQLFYPGYQSFINRVHTCYTDDSENAYLVPVVRGDTYIREHAVGPLDVLKVDVEGFERNVLASFENVLSTIQMVQFTYGGTFIDSASSLRDVHDLLMDHGFEVFGILGQQKNGRALIQPITSFDDHFKYCQIIAFHSNIRHEFECVKQNLLGVPIPSIHPPVVVQPSRPLTLAELRALQLKDKSRVGRQPIRQ